MANSSSTPSSTITTLTKKHDVFLSFRGEDTRDGFVSHLYAALCRKQIKTFIDYQLIRGEEISPALLRAIDESKISVVVFSKDYISSKWCLRELVEIMKCRKMNKQIVMPVFYHVQPSDVRKQAGSLKNSFDNFGKELQEEVQTWREALTEASNLSGWDSSVTRPESKLIDEIVEGIWKKLMGDFKSSSSDFKGLIGIKKRIEAVISLLCLDTMDYRIIGIWGMGGIGKTTIVDAIFNLISYKFEGVCFIQNVRERMGYCGGLGRLKDEILSKVLGEANLNLDTLTIPRNIKERLNQLRVLVVLDDVNNFLQLETLVEGLNHCGLGTRILITSRDKQALQNCGVDDHNIYEVRGFDHDQSLKLFYKYAFKQNPPAEDLMVLSYMIADYAKGNPLTLKVLGSSLYRKSKQVWISALDKLQRTLNSEIFDVLKISYDELNDEEKNLFLDIACFFKEHDEDYVAHILGDCYYSLSVLIDKSLITKKYNKIQMHDLLQEMGREIVQKESPNKPGKRSRLWKQEDVLHTLKNANGTDALRGIFFNMCEIKDLQFNSQAFAEMKNLGFLKVYDSTFNGFGAYSSKMHFPNGLSYLSDELTSLNWLGCPLKALPSNFNPENLVELRLIKSNLEKLWEKTMYAPKLKWLILFDCLHLTKISDLLDAPLLELINLQNCRSLLDFPPSVLHLNNLSELNMKDCKSVQTNIHVTSLRSLDLDGCINPPGLPDPSKALLLAFPSHVHLNNLRELNMNGCENLQSFPNNICFPSLKKLNLFGCFNLIRISDFLDAPLVRNINLEDCKSLLDFPSLVQPLNKLYNLNMRGCENLRNFPNNIHFPSLVHLDLYGCVNLIKISDLLDAPLLRKIDIGNCKSLLDFPSPVENFGNLDELNMIGCKNLRSFPSNIHFYCRLSLDFHWCINLMKFPQCSGNILRLDLSGTAIDEVPLSIENLTKLVELYLSECMRLKHISTNICKLKSLKSLSLRNCCQVESFPEILDPMECLEFLDLSGTAIKELPYSIEHLNGLCKLSLRECKILERLPSSLCRLLSLRYLNVSSCNMLQSLTELPSGLEHLIAIECKQLRSIPDASQFAGFIKGTQCNMHRNSVDREFIFTNCLNLNETACDNILKMIFQNMAMGYGHEDVKLSICYPGSEIPRWFSYQTYGSSLNFQVPWHDCFNGNVLGFALCVVIAFKEYHHPSLGNLYVYYRYKDGTYKRSTNSILVASVDRTLIDSDHVAIGYCKYERGPIPRINKSEFTDSLLEFWLSVKSPNCRVKYCGACPMYANFNVVPSIPNEKFGATDQDFGETIVKEHNKIRKIHDDEASKNGKLDGEEMESHPKRSSAN